MSWSDRIKLDFSKQTKYLGVIFRLKASVANLASFALYLALFVPSNATTITLFSVFWENINHIDNK